MADEYTPTDDEVKTDYLNLQSFVADEDDVNANYEALMQWNRWRAAHDAQVERVAAVKALREAAQKFPNSSTWMIREWIRGEADRIESEGTA